jgi:hypothetical protein
MEGNDGRDTTHFPVGSGERSAAVGVGPVHGARDAPQGADVRARRPVDYPGEAVGCLGEAFAAFGAAVGEAFEALGAGLAEAGRPCLGFRRGWSRWRVVAVLLGLLAAIMIAGPLWWMLGIITAP